MSLSQSQTYQGVSQADADRIVRAALDAGITLFDNAPMYGEGDAEEKLGRALKGARDRAVIATKASGLTLSADEIARDCEASLRRLQTDVIDLYQIHWNRRAVPAQETASALTRLVEQGKVRAIGVCNYGPADLDEFLSLSPCVTDQVAYSLLTRAVEFELIPLCDGRGVGLICYSPLAQGLLTGRFRKPEDVPIGRARTRHFSRHRPETTHGEDGCEKELFAAVTEIAAIAQDLATPMSQLSLAWLLHQPNVTAVLVGASSPEQVRENIVALQLKFNAEQLARISEATEAVRIKMGSNLDPWQNGGRIR